MSKDPVPDWFGKSDVEADQGRRSVSHVVAAPETRGSGCALPLAILMLALAAGGGWFAIQFASREKPTVVATKPAVPVPTPAPTPEPQMVPEPAVEPAPAPEPAPVASAEEPPEEGAALAAGDVRLVMEKNRGRFRTCYENALSYTPDAAGSIFLTLKIAPTGRVQTANTTQTGNLPTQVGACIAAITRTLKFPESAQSTTVSYPFAFSAQ